MDPEALPFTVVSESRRPSGAGWMTAQPLEKASRLPVFDGNWDSWNDKWQQWVNTVQAVPASGLAIDFTVQGTSDAEVTLTGLEVRVTARRPAFSGVHVGDMGAGDTPYRFVSADLDVAPPKLTDFFDPTFGQRMPPNQLRPIQFPYQVKISDAESFEVHASTRLCDCEFVIDLTWSALGRKGTTTIDNKGKPFHIAGTSAATDYCVALPYEGHENSCRPV
ncbi:hypothetical protein GCM10023319_79960 [Nocardia iowensis]